MLGKILLILYIIVFSIGILAIIIGYFEDPEDWTLIELVQGLVICLTWPITFPAYMSKN